MKTQSKSLLEYMSDEHFRPSRPIGDFSWVNTKTPLEELDLNWKESGMPERLRTKHVHRLHPYLGKYVPQLVEIFLRKFNPGVVCDPFCGSGTTLVEANALDIGSIGCDVSEFNCLLARVKTARYNIRKLEKEVKEILAKTTSTLHERESTVEMLVSSETSLYLKKWFHKKALGQLLTYRKLLSEYEYQDILKIILSRAARSARLTTHFDLDFPAKPQTTPYWCYKHSRTCHPTDNALLFLKRYSGDTIERVREYSGVRTDASADVYCGDARTMNFPKCDMIMTSPPYVGLIDYHEQHRYAYELLNLRDKRELEIGAASNGHSKKAQLEYISEIGKVLANVRGSMNDNGVAVIVVHDKNNLYKELSGKVGFKEVRTLERHVDRRTGRRSSQFFEQILIWKTS